MKMKPIPILLTLLFLALLLSACGNGGSGASTAVESYFGALTAKDADQLINLSCAAWESSAQTELEGFGGVETSLEGLSCQVAGADGDFTTVTCQGTIIASYGEENLEIELENATYLAIEEGGEWRMCGRQ